MSTGQRYKMVSTTTLSAEVPIRSGSGVSLPPSTATGIVFSEPLTTTSYHVNLFARDSAGARVELGDATSLIVSGFDVTNPTTDTLTLSWEAFVP